MVPNRRRRWGLLEHAAFSLTMLVSVHGLAALLVAGVPMRIVEFAIYLHIDDYSLLNPVVRAAAGSLVLCLWTIAASRSKARHARSGMIDHPVRLHLPERA